MTVTDKHTTFLIRARQWRQAYGQELLQGARQLAAAATVRAHEQVLQTWEEAHYGSCWVTDDTHQRYLEYTLGGGGPAMGLRFCWKGGRFAYALLWYQDWFEYKQYFRLDSVEFAAALQLYVPREP